MVTAIPMRPHPPLPLSCQDMHRAIIEIGQLKHAHGWNRLVSPGQHYAPLMSSHAWQFASRDKMSTGKNPVVVHEAGSALCFAYTTHSQVRHYEVLGAGGDACPLLGDRPVALLGDYLGNFRQALRQASFEISGVLAKSSMERQIHSAFQRNYGLTVQPGRTARSASLDGGIEGYLSRRSAHLRKNLRRENRRAMQMGIRFERVRPSTASGARMHMRRMLAIEAASWKGGNPHACNLLRAQGFNSALLERLAVAQDARIVYAMHGKTDIGFIFGGVVGGVYGGLHFGFHQDWAKHSIGNLLQIEKVRWLCEQGVMRYDMGIDGNGRLAYKQHWAEIIVDSVDFTLRCP